MNIQRILQAFILFFAFTFVAQAQVDISTVSTGPDDGRFTLGADGKRLMYGYPVPKSTSHFILAVDGEYASNSSRVKGATYLSSKKQVQGVAGTPTVRITFLFKGIKVTQMLTPVDRNYKTIDQAGQLAQYYKVEYDIKNFSGEDKEVGLLSLFDTMIDGNDACVIDADETRVTQETAFVGDVPSEYLLYETPDNRDDMLGICVVRQEEAKLTPPDELYVGRWPYLRTVIWEVEAKDTKYGDSAILMKWKKEKLANKATRNYAVLYGLPQDKEPTLSVLIENRSLKNDSLTIFYGMGSSNINKQNRQEIDAFMANRSVEGITIYGYSDAVGSEQAANQIALKRIKNIANYIQANHNTPITFKPRGNKDAEVNAQTITSGKSEDRKALLIVHYNEIENTEEITAQNN